MSMDTEIFDKAESQRMALEQKLQLTSNELTCVLLLILAKDFGVPIPTVFSKLLTNYSIFLDPTIPGDLNKEKQAIRFYCGTMGIEVLTLNVLLSNLIARKRGIAGINSVLSGDSLPDLQPPKNGW